MARLTVKERMIAAGLFERLVAILANSKNSKGGPLGEIPAGSAANWRPMVAAFKELGLSSPQAKQAFEELSESARLAHNAAHRFQKQNRPSVGNLNQIPCREVAGGRCDGQIAVDAFVTIRDPLSGQEYRTLIRARFDSPPTRAELERALLNAASANADSGASGRGYLSPGSGTQLSSYSVSGIYGVNS